MGPVLVLKNYSNSIFNIYFILCEKIPVCLCYKPCSSWELVKFTSWRTLFRTRLGMIFTIFNLVRYQTAPGQIPNIGQIPTWSAWNNWTETTDRTSTRDCFQRFNFFEIVFFKKHFFSIINNLHFIFNF